ncbi:hypothetical protein EVAR_6603_1 [Eumeta japonica]|uniref:Uncharacterized protein n=1 Tax=Eumeta variegata TaxID=151549 RepID=A0A4C1TK93_EUMVA|nr:hypothetical protein EVAR_6603_1 [Eumeta japonica]
MCSMDGVNKLSSMNPSIRGVPQDYLNLYLPVVPSDAVKCVNSINDKLKRLTHWSDRNSLVLNPTTQQELSPLRMFYQRHKTVARPRPTPANSIWAAYKFRRSSSRGIHNAGTRRARNRYEHAARPLHRADCATAEYQRCLRAFINFFKE